jgi:hypothetical protein
MIETALRRGAWLRTGQQLPLANQLPNCPLSFHRSCRVLLSARLRDSLSRGCGSAPGGVQRQTKQG